jgi:threonine synthase
VKHDRAVTELIDLGLVEGSKRPALTGAQALGCSPVATSFGTGESCVPVRPDTIAKSIAIGNPSDGDDVVRLARASGGVVERVTEEEIRTGMELLAQTEGIFTETAGGVTVAVLRKLAEARRWQGDETVVAYITGHGLKTAEVLDGRTELDEPIAPSLRAFRSQYGAAAVQETPGITV